MTGLYIGKVYTHKFAPWNLNKSEDDIKRLTPNSEYADVTFPVHLRMLCLIKSVESPRKQVPE